MFVLQSISNARIDGRILKVTKSARYSRAEPEEKMSLCGVKSLQLRYVILSHFIVNF